MRILFLVVLASILLPMAGTLTFLEARALVSRAGERDSRFQAYAEGKAMRGFSVQSHKTFLRDCLTMATSIHGRLQNPEMRHTVLTHCKSETAAIIKITPTHSLAWATQAVIAAELGELDVLNDALNKARMTGPNEQGLAQMRVEISEENYPNLTPENQTGNQQDLQLLVQSSHGAKAIAHRYLQHPDSQRRITIILEKLPEKAQQHFLQNLTQAAREMGQL